MEIQLNSENFEELVLKSEIPVLVDFWAVWCGPCMLIAPIISELSETYAGKIAVGKLNVDEGRNNEIAGRYSAMSIPTQKLFIGGEIVGEIVGAVRKEMIESMIEKHLAAEPETGPETQVESKDEARPEDQEPKQ